MPIPAAHAQRYAFHSTHLNNLPSVLEHGFLSCNHQLRLGVDHHSIAASSIQERRSQMIVPVGPCGVVHDYVPLYFTKRSPMLLAQVNAKNIDQVLLVHYAFPVGLVDRADVVFTDAAANRSTPPTFYSDPVHLDKLIWAAIDSGKWGSRIDGVDRKHERMAEVLVHDRLDPADVAYVVVWNKWMKAKVQEAYSEAGLNPPQIRFNGPHDSHIFSHFRNGLPKDMLNCSVASGPIWTKLKYDKVVAAIVEKNDRAQQPKFVSLEEMLDALRRNGLEALPETGELVNLVSANDVHEHDVGTHTLNVVDRLVASPEYRALSAHSQTVTEVAAYLHDVGKGPKSRWAGCDGKQQIDPDHPIRSMEMLVRILTEDVAPLEPEVVRQLCKLVCYHDIVGDTIGRGRDRQQLVDVAESEVDLELLVAIGLADMASVVEAWGTTGSDEVPELRAWVVAQFNR